MKFEEVVSNTIDPKLLIPEIIIDAEVSFCDIKTSFYSIIQQMEPFGPENMRPVFITKKRFRNRLFKNCERAAYKVCAETG